MKHIKSDYVPKGGLKGFPLEVIDKMMERQVEQGNKPNAVVFDDFIEADSCQGGFDWDEAVEGHGFWERVIGGDHNLFFQKYPKNKYPKVMMVSDNGVRWKQRVVFTEKRGGYMAWANAETMEDAERAYSTVSWNYAKDIDTEPQLIHLTIEDISAGKGVGIDPKLIRIKQ